MPPKRDPIWGLVFDSIGPVHPNTRRYKARCKFCAPPLESDPNTTESDDSHNLEGRLELLYHSYTSLIVPHSADPERIFSILAHFDTKYRNRLKTSTLKKLAQSKIWLMQEGKEIESEIESTNQRYDAIIEKMEVPRQEPGTEMDDMIDIENPEETNLEELDSLFDSMRVEDISDCEFNDRATSFGEAEYGVSDWTCHSNPEEMRDYAKRAERKDGESASIEEIMGEVL
ncbi:hypothetical protein BKA69DRAFT_1175143 [Paraphysoderma sedebokerense]|nr:hypothetical protein BKA69DRAFT_1175143 [Paraphysoderma sedebokerense]